MWDLNLHLENTLNKLYLCFILTMWDLNNGEIDVGGELVEFHLNYVGFKLER